MYSSPMGESSGSSNQRTLAIETQPSLASYLPPSCLDPSGSYAERTSHVTSIEEIIEQSKSHWSQLKDFDSDNEVAEVSNMEAFKTLQAYPTWGSFFKTFGKGEGSYGELVIGEKFAEGGQAKIYEVQVKWYDLVSYEDDLKHSRKHVLKVFKKGTSLCHLQSQWPQGLLQFHVDLKNRAKLGLPFPIRYHSDVICGTLLEDGRFAFLMVKEKEDLRNMINHLMLMRSNNEGPFPIWMALEAMYDIAFGMNQLHNHGIVHRDIKASNVLVDNNMICYIADFECSVGVVGTGFWRAPEVLEACKNGNVSTKAKLFSKVVDIYSYGMTCYEILTGKLPFEGHPWNDYDLVLQGQRPEVPNYVDGWIQKLLSRCWQSNPVACPSSQEILKILQANSSSCRKHDIQIQKLEIEHGIRNALNSNLKILEMWRSLQLKLKFPNLKRHSS